MLVKRVEFQDNFLMQANILPAFDEISTMLHSRVFVQLEYGVILNAYADGISVGILSAVSRQAEEDSGGNLDAEQTPPVPGQHTQG